MMCCNNIEDLGCFKSCEPSINTGLIAPTTGKYRIEIQFFNMVKCIELEIEANEEIKFPNMLNENTTHIIRIYREYKETDDHALASALSFPLGLSQHLLLNNTCYKLKTIQSKCI